MEAFILIAVGGAIIGVYVWVGSHIGNSKRHTNKDNIVFQDVCRERGDRNDMEHEHLKEGIEKAIGRSDEKHNELKAEMEKGFNNLADLIKANGNGRRT